MFIRNETDERGARGLFTRRAAVMSLAQAVGFTVLGARLYQLQVMEGNRYAPLAETNRLTMHPLAPIRGRIFDRTGALMADNVESFRLVLTPSLAGDVKRVLAEVRKIVPLTDDEVADVVKLARRQSPNLPITVTGELTFEQVARVAVLAPQLPGIETELYGERRYFKGREMGHIVGHVGSVARFALDHDPILRLPGMRIGKIGVEHAEERRLRGVGGWVKREVDARGRVVRDLERVEAKRGGDVVLTVDTDLQARFLKRMSTVRRGAAVAIRVDTGEIMAMASWPTVDVTEIGEGISQKDWNRISKLRGDPLFNRTIRGLYPPGSTFKMITALAALESGDVSLTERINCTGTYKLAEQDFRCWNRGGHGPCNLHRALRESCDVYFYEIAHRMGISKIAEMAERFGLGQVYEDAGLAFQKKGIVPTPGWKRGRYGKRWLGGETLIAGIGQGYVSSNPLQLAVMTARLATGREVQPTVVNPLSGTEPAPFADLDIDPKHLRAVQRAMRAVVHEGSGTGKRASMTDYGFEVAGKTGTSQVTRLSALRSQRSLPWRFRDHALFVSYFPVDAPKYAVSVIVEHGGSGGTTAAPLARDLMEELVAYEKEAKPPFQLREAQDVAQQAALSETARPAETAAAPVGRSTQR
jgi:penicillin-binding protein 2